MGFHVCEFCQSEDRKPHMSSGDVTLTFDNGHSWVMPDMILHYMADHGYVPPQEFRDDVMHGRAVETRRAQTKAIPRMVGYLTAKDANEMGGSCPEVFMRLWSLMQIAAMVGDRWQTRGIA